MNITRAKLKETLRTIVNEESEYQSFFKAALEKAGKSIPDMSEEEKKAFFNKIDSAWDAKGEKNEALVGGQKELDVDGDGDIEADDLADLRAGKKADESVTEGKKVFKVNPGIGKAKYSISSHDGVKKHKDGSDFFDIEIFKNKVDLEKGIKNYTSKGFVKESVNESTKDDDYADELQKETEKVLKGKNIKGWKLYVDSRSGTFEFEKKGIDLLIYATPMWDGNPNLPFNVMDGEGDNVNMIEKLIGNKLPFKPSYDLKKDISNYISVLTNALSKVEVLYNKMNNEVASLRFMFDFYTDSNQRSTEREVNFIAPNLEAAISEAESMCKKLKLGYVEIYYKDLFLGSMKQQNGFKFVEGRGYSKFKSTN